jgi:50S ribosomal subunit-associated GTPase HflX
MIEVWNKVDLLTKEQQELLPSATGNNVFHVSVLKGTGVKNLMERVEAISDEVLNKGTYKFKYSID